MPTRSPVNGPGPTPTTTASRSAGTMTGLGEALEDVRGQHLRVGTRVDRDPGRQGSCGCRRRQGGPPRRSRQAWRYRRRVRARLPRIPAQRPHPTQDPLAPCARPTPVRAADRTRRCRSASCSTTPSPHSTTTTAPARSVSRSRASSSSRSVPVGADAQPVRVDVHHRHRLTAAGRSPPARCSRAMMNVGEVTRPCTPSPARDSPRERGLARTEWAVEHHQVARRPAPGRGAAERLGVLGRRQWIVR